jgi:hypothetical protein
MALPPSWPAKARPAQDAAAPIRPIRERSVPSATAHDLEERRRPEAEEGLAFVEAGGPAVPAFVTAGIRERCLQAAADDVERPEAAAAPLARGKVYQTDPLVWARCGQCMSLVAFVTDQIAIRRILDHLGLTTPQAEKPPPPVPEILRVAEHGDGWGVPAQWE